MLESDSLSALKLRLWNQLEPLLVLHNHKRPLGFLAVAALSSGLPVFVGAWLDQFSTSILASMGGLVILYMQQTPIAQRMITLAICALGFAASFTLSVLTGFDLYLSSASLALTVFLATLVCRICSVPPPASFMFILVACIAKTLPFDLPLVAERAGILLLGCAGACFLAFGYSVVQIYWLKNPVVEQARADHHGVVAIILEASVIGLFVGGGYLFALLVNLDNPYWVPVSTAAIMQGATFRAVWHRKVHRIFGTVIGMALAWVIFSFSPGVWQLAALIMLLSFLIEVLITRNYGLAVIFVTPLTVIFADSSLASAQTNQLIMSRLFDIILGSSIGYLGGWVIHHTRFFLYLERLLKSR